MGQYDAISWHGYLRYQGCIYIPLKADKNNLHLWLDVTEANGAFRTFRVAPCEFSKFERTYTQCTLQATIVVYYPQFMKYCNILNTNPGAISIHKHILWGLCSGRLIFWGLISAGVYQEAIFVSICKLKLLESIIISMNYKYCWQRRSFFKPKSNLFSFQT